MLMRFEGMTREKSSVGTCFVWFGQVDFDEFLLMMNNKIKVCTWFSFFVRRGVEGMFLCRRLR